MRAWKHTAGKPRLRPASAKLRRSYITKCATKKAQSIRSAPLMRPKPNLTQLTPSEFGAKTSQASQGQAEQGCRGSAIRNMATFCSKERDVGDVLAGINIHLHGTLAAKTFVRTHWIQSIKLIGIPVAYSAVFHQNVVQFETTPGQIPRDRRGERVGTAKSELTLLKGLRTPSEERK
jgi:hypothetical protein